MSQVKFKTEYENKRVEVVGGWDNPLQSFHLTIFDLDAPEDEEEVIWCHLLDGGYCKTLNAIKKQLEKMEIEVPNEFFEHCSKREGNVVYIHGADNWSRFKM